MHLLYYLTVRTDVIEPVEASREESESTYPIQRGFSGPMTAWAAENPRWIRFP